MKANPWKLVRAHYKTLTDEAGEARARDYLLFIGFPVAVYILCLVLQAQLPGEAAAGLLTATGILSAFFFSVVLQVAQKAMELADRPPQEEDKPTKWQIKFLKEIAASAGYACLVSVLVATVSLVSLIATSELIIVVFSSLAIALAVHLVLLLSMVLTRVYSLIMRRLRTANVGGPKGRGNVHPIDDRRAGSAK